MAGIEGINTVGQVACCPLGCGLCGGKGCGRAPGGNKSCCVNGVLGNQPDCAITLTAPCYISDGQCWLAVLLASGSSDSISLLRCIITRFRRRRRPIKQYGTICSSWNQNFRCRGVLGTLFVGSLLRIVVVRKITASRTRAGLKILRSTPPTAFFCNLWTDACDLADSSVGHAIVSSDARVMNQTLYCNSDGHGVYAFLCIPSLSCLPDVSTPAPVDNPTPAPVNDSTPTPVDGECILCHLTYGNGAVNKVRPRVETVPLLSRKMVTRR